MPVMITGDHPATARAIAARLGILDHAGRIVTGSELAALSDPDFAAQVKDIRVYARVDPEQKIRIVRDLQAAGEFAAMTGDRVNDAPALKLWINLVTDGLPGLALAAERAEGDTMRRPPRRPDESIFAHGMWQQMLWVGLLMGAVCLILKVWAIEHSGSQWQTMVFTVLVLSQLGHVMAIRSERDSLFRIGLASNRPLLAAVALQLATVYTPALNPTFKTEPLGWDELAICLGLSTLVFFAVEAEKWLARRGCSTRTRRPGSEDRTGPSRDVTRNDPEASGRCGRSRPPVA